MIQGPSAYFATANVFFCSGIDLRIELLYGLRDGIFFGLQLGLSYILIHLILEAQTGDVHLTERLRWTLRSLRRGLFNAKHLRLSGWLTCISIIFIGLSDALIYDQSYLFSDAIWSTFRNGLNYGLSYWFVLGLLHGIAQEHIEDQDRHILNQGIRSSLHNGVTMGAISIAMITITAILIFLPGQLMNHPHLYQFLFGLLYSCFSALSISPYVGLLACMTTGGLTVWRHCTIRFLLWHSQTFPMRAPHFLDDSVARFLLRRVGGGYIFSHRLLLDYLADTTERSTEQPEALMPMHSKLSSLW
jgi:hypothetical protein